MIFDQNFSNNIKPFVNELHCDALGNIIAHKVGIGKRLMLIAHQDVVCLMITHIDENGFLYVKPAGGIDVNILPARSVTIMHDGNKVAGVIGKQPIHLLREEQNCKVTYDNLWIDIGAKDKSEAMSMVSKGDYAYFSSVYEELPNDLIIGAYFDDNIGLKIMLEVAEKIENNDVNYDIYFVASNHEEIGMRGGIVAAHSIQPDVCICIDTTHATDYPTMDIITYGDIKLGGGCVLAKGPNVHPQLFKTLENAAINRGIKYQVEVSPYPTGTDANMVQLSGDGVKTAVVSVPCRYMHTPYEVCSKKDIESAINIIYQFVQISNDHD